MANDFVSDQTIFDAGFTSRRQFNEHCRLEGLKAEREAARQANTVQASRSSSRFNPGESGVPPSKHRLAEETRRVTEARAKELYQQIVLHRAAGIPVNHDMAEWANLLGFTQATVRQSVDYFNSPEAKQRFGTTE